MTRPLRRLADRAAMVREGRLDVEIPHGGGKEVEGLARALPAAAGRLDFHRPAADLARLVAPEEPAVQP